MIKEIKVDESFIQDMEQYRQPTSEEREKGIIYAGSRNIMVFCEKMLGIRPYAWQVYVLKDIQKAILERKDQVLKIQAGDKSIKITLDKEEFIILTSRQIGKSTMLAFLSLWACVYNHVPATVGFNTSVIIVSAGDTQAKKLLNEVNRMIRLGDAQMNKYGYEDFFSNLLDDVESNNKQQISFMPWKEKHGEYLLNGSKLGSTIKSYPPTSIVLGESASLVIEDEAGKTEKITDEFHKEYLYPVGNSTHALRMYTSTPWVCNGFFYKLCDPEEMFEHKETEITYMFTIDAIEIENPAYYESVKKDIAREISNGNLDAVQRAYYCKFVKGETNYFDPQDVVDSFKDYKMYESYKGECDMGVDFGGQTTSRTVITISKLDDNGNVMRLYHKCYAVGEDSNLLEDIAELFTKFNIQRIIPDDCLAAGTEVLMSDYTRKAIQDIKRGDKVMSFNFNTNTYEPKFVTQTNARGVADTYRIEFRNGTDIIASPKHKWFVKDRKTDKLSVVTTEQLNLKKHYLPVALNIPSYGVREVTYAEAYILGMYIAEGHKRPTKHGFFISQLKKDTREVIKQHLSATNIKWQENKKGFYLSNTYELEYLFSACGTSSYTKRIPVECFRWDSDLLEGLYYGMIDGDGYIQHEKTDKRGYKVSRTESYYTVSKQLNNDMRTLMLLLNKPTHYRAREKSGFGSTKLQYEPVWSMGSYMNDGKLFIKSIRKSSPKETYDITVEDNESFILPDIGVITHNCAQGDYLIREMIDMGWNVQPMSFATWKVKKYGAFRAILHRGCISSYLDEDLKLEMLGMEQHQGVRNTIIKHSSGTNDDMIDSFVMSCFFFVTEDGGIKNYSWKDIIVNDGEGLDWDSL